MTHKWEYSRPTPGDVVGPTDMLGGRLPGTRAGTRSAQPARLLATVCPSLCQWLPVRLLFLCSPAPMAVSALVPSTRGEANSPTPCVQEEASSWPSLCYVSSPRPVTGSQWGLNPLVTDMATGGPAWARGPVGWADASEVSLKVPG